MAPSKKIRKSSHQGFIKQQNESVLKQKKYFCSGEVIRQPAST